MASFECHFCSFYVFLPKHFLPKVSAVYCCIMRCSVFWGFFGRAYCVWDAWSTLDCECFLWGCGELDRGQTSHFTSSSIVLQTVPASLAKRQPEETFSTLLVSTFSFFFSFLLSISPGHSVLFVFPFLLSSHTISVPKPSPILACLRHLLSFSFCLSC